MQKAKIIAHRGASHESPENTLVSIQKAIDLKVDCIEIDIHLSKDHIPVVIHDETIERTTSLKEKQHISSMTLKDIKKLDAGSWYHAAFKGEIIPTLKEVLALDFQGCGLMIEIKKSLYPAPLVVEKILKVVHEAKPQNTLIYGSFEADLLHAVSTLDSHANLIHIIEEEENINQFQGHYVAVSEKLLSAPLIKQLSEKNKEIWTFTIDSAKRAKEVNTSGIAGIITNNPRLMKKVFS